MAIIGHTLRCLTQLGEKMNLQAALASIPWLFCIGTPPDLCYTALQYNVLGLAQQTLSLHMLGNSLVGYTSELCNQPLSLLMDACVCTVCPTETKPLYPAGVFCNSVCSLSLVSFACVFRLELALHGWCSEDCEDLLQHFITVHLGSRDAAGDPSMQDVLPALSNAGNVSANSNLNAAVFLHERFARLFTEYSDARNLRGSPWFYVKLPKKP